jgi:hypothetical protein
MRAQLPDIRSSVSFRTPTRIPVLATSDIRSKIRKETANKKLSRHLLHVETTRKSNG